MRKRTFERSSKVLFLIAVAEDVGFLVRAPAVCPVLRRLGELAIHLPAICLADPLVLVACPFTSQQLHRKLARQ